MTMIKYDLKSAQIFLYDFSVAYGRRTRIMKAVRMVSNPDW